LKTDASWRFEHGLDPNLTEIGINRVAEIIQESAKGKLASGLVDFYPKKAESRKIKLDLKYVEKLLGVKIPEKEVKRILESLGLKIKNSKATLRGVRFASRKILNVVVPTFRLDISLPEDLIEEISRIYGYEKIPSTFPVVSLIPGKRNLEIFWEKMSKDILKEAAFTEIYNYSFIGDGKDDISLDYWNKERMIELENPMSKEQKYLRPSLIPNLLKNVKNNLRYVKEIKIFELGKVFFKDVEKRMLTGVIIGEEGNECFYQTKGIIDLLLNKLGISDIWYDEFGISPESGKLLFWDLKKCAEIKIGNNKIGFLGKVSEKILEKLKIKKEIFLFDVDFEKLTKLCSEEHEYQPISQYPAAVRDLAILVPIDIKVVDVLNKINIAGGSLVRDVDLFDIYEGENIVQGKKNLAFHIVYQAEDRTLTSKEIDDIQDKIIKILEKDPDWEVRR